jgi:hypothetical protein
MCATCVFRTDGRQLKRPTGRLDEIKHNAEAGRRHVCHTDGLDQNYDPISYCRGADRFLPTNQ